MIENLLLRIEQRNNFPFIEKIAKPAGPVNDQDKRHILCAAVDWLGWLY